ncbi:MAG: aminoglycoside phosphotransferase family protein [Actinobacteria bacterium]|nr:aminoglycoside phosphotransferase family protein [Actinomycetota bacterium]
MDAPAPPDADSLARVLEAVDPALWLISSGSLPGGTSAQVTALEVGLPGGATGTLVLRQYGPANLRADPHIATHEHQLLTLLCAAGLPVPRPRCGNESREILPVPYLVTSLIVGETCTDPTELTLPLADFTGQLAHFLACLHSAGVAHTVPYLTEVRDIAAQRVGTLPACLDATLSEPAVRTALASIWPPPQLNKPVLLHGDYWPGNVLWHNGVLAGVVDWEDAAVGDPLADVGCARMELWMAFGAAAAQEFTKAYLALMPQLDMTALPHWDLYAALRHAGKMAGWGLQPGELAKLQAGHRDFTTAALARASAR